jgi:hypothetical protein
VDNSTNWKPDPFGTHELRFFSADGKPTLLVMDGGKRSYDKPPTDQVGDLPEADPRKPDQLPSQLTPADTQPVAPAAHSAAPSPTEEAERARNGGAPRVTDQLESDPMPPPRSTSAQPRPDAPSVPLGSEPVTLSAPLESSREHVSTLVLGPTGVAADATVFAAAANPMADESSRHLADNVREHREEPMSRAMKIAYCVVCGVLAISALGVLYVHLHHADGTRPLRAASPTTTTTSQVPKNPNTVVLPSRLSPTAEVAADDLVTSWSMNERLGALAVATPTAASTLFSTTYASGQAISRGCSTSFTPIVCTFGPPGGASPTDPIYEIRVSQVAGGWYVSSVRIEN